MSEAPRIGVSACLLGHEVRFDGGHKRSAFVVDALGRFAELVPVCPEMELGLGTPRESLRLERKGEGGVHLVAPRSGTDRTSAMRAWAEARVAGLASSALSGFVLKKKSPSCGLFRVPVYGPGGIPTYDGTGLFAEAVRAGMPDLPVEEEGRLNDPALRDAFLVRVFARHRLLVLLDSGPDRAALMAFHAREKLLLLARAPGVQTRLGRGLAEADGRTREEAASVYAAGFLAALAGRGSPGREANVMQHMAGYVSKRIPAGDRRELADAIDAYRRGAASRHVPLTLLRHHVRREGVGYLADQSWLDPYPAALAP